jgi:protein-S-isoprenylcysteine O-methyltransferase Ste14
MHPILLIRFAAHHFLASDSGRFAGGVIDRLVTASEHEAVDALQLKIPPVAQFLLAAMVMWLVSAGAGFAAVAVPGRLLPASVVLLCAGLVGLAAVRSFAREQTSVNPLRPEAASRLVVRGIYRYSRNPMYLALALALLAWGILLGNLLALLVVPLFVLAMNRLQIAPEERALRAMFGADYEAYLREVRRWL